MTKPGFTRASVIAMALGALAVSAAPAMATSRNPAAEQHVLTNANAALAALSGSGAAREQSFRTVIARTADIQSISTFVLGRYASTVRADAALQAQWTKTFSDYVYAVYLDRLARHGGGRLQVTGSIERIAGRDVIVKSEIPSSSTGRPLSLQWRLLKGDAGWRVVDISFVADGSEVWLAQQQRSEFATELDQNRGDVRALIARLSERTAQLKRGGG